MHDIGASIDPRSHGPTFPPGFYLAARPIYDLASAVSASATDVMADQIAGGKIGEKESRDRALAQSPPATSSTPSKRPSRERAHERTSETFSGQFRAFLGATLAGEGNK